MIYKIIYKNWLRLPDFMKSAFISLSIFLLITSFFNFTYKVLGIGKISKTPKIRHYGVLQRTQQKLEVWIFKCAL